jgi:hypothetical protein
MRDVGVEAGVNDLEGAVRFRGPDGQRQVHGGLGSSIKGVDLFEAGEETGVIAKRGADGVVGVAGLPVGKDDDARAEMADDARDSDAVVEGVFDGAVGQGECLAPADAEDAGGFIGFAGAVFGSTPGAGFALGEVEDGGAEAAGGGAEHGSAAGLLGVVSVSCDG